jgi:hypothetical protein
MEQYQPSSLQSQLNLFQPHDTPTLTLQTAFAANGAYLEQGDTGRVDLYFHGLHYGVDDYVSESLIRSLSASPNGTAGDFVLRQMLMHYGYHEDGWPSLARLFCCSMPRHSL